MGSATPVAVAYSRLSAPIVRAEVALSADGLGADVVLGSFAVEGIAYAVESNGLAKVVAAGPDSAAAGSTLAIPAEVAYGERTYEVTAIGAHALSLCEADVVALSSSVTSIDQDALWPTAVQRVEVDPANPTYASCDGILYDADLTRLLSIPGGRQGAVRIVDNMEVMEASAFSHCAGVDAISVDAGSAAFASWDGLLYDATGTTLVRVAPAAKSIVIREGCTAVAAGSLEGCAQLVRIEAPASLVSVDASALALPALTPNPVAATLVADSEASDAALEVASPEEPTQFSSVASLASGAAEGEALQPSEVEVHVPTQASAEPWAALGFDVQAEEGASDTAQAEEGALAGDSQGVPIVAAALAQDAFGSTAVESVVHSAEHLAAELAAEGLGEELPLVASSQGAATYGASYAFTLLASAGATLYKTNSSGSTQTAVATPATISCTDASHVTNIQFIEKNSKAILALWHSSTKAYYFWVKPGYVLSGVKVTGADGTTETLTPSALSTTYKGTIKKQTRTVEPIWTPITYTITLNNMSATTSGTASVSARYGGTLPSITPPTKAGYRFKGYYRYSSSTSPGTRYYDEKGAPLATWDQYESIPSSFSTTRTVGTLYARWVKAVTVYGNGGTLTVSRSRATTLYGERTPVETLTSASSYAIEAPADVYGNRIETWYQDTDGYWYYTQIVSNARTGYKRISWTGDDATVAWNATSFKSSSGDALYAIWKAIPTFTLYPNGSGATINGSTATFSLRDFVTDYALYNWGRFDYRTYNSDGTLSVKTVTAARTGYDFAGWATSATGTGASATISTSQDTVNGQDGFTYYATWKAHAYTIAYSSNGGTGTMASTSATYGTNPTISKCTFTAPSMKRFMGWNTKADGTGTAVPGSTTAATTYAGNLTATQGATVTLYAVWANDGVIVDMNGGIATVVNCEAAGQQSFFNLTTSDAVVFSKEYAQVWLNSGGAANVRVQSVKREGYRFCGWSTNKGCAVADATSITWRQSTMGNVTVYAIWDQVVTVDMQGGTATVVNCDAAGERGSFQLATTYAVIFAKGGTAWLNSGGGDNNRITGVKREGYRFCGWSTNKGCAAADANSYSWYRSAGPVTLYAIWDPLVTVDMQGGTATVVNCDAAGERGSFQLATTYAVIFAKGGTAWLNSGGGDNNRITGVKREGYRFCGWSTNKGCAAADANSYSWYRSAGPVTLYAIWEPLITVDMNGGTATLFGVPEQTKVSHVYTGRINQFNATSGSWDHSGLVIATAYAREGYGFCGWSTDQACEPADAGSYLWLGTEPVTLYAIWEPLLVLDMQGGTIKMVEDGTPVATRSWRAELAPMDFYPSGDVWTNAGAHVSTEPSRTGYRFVGFSQDKDAEEGSSEQLRVDVSEATYVYAIWQPITYQVRFDPAGGEWEGALWDDDALSNPLPVAYDHDMVTARAPKKAGRVFKAWSFEGVVDGVAVEATYEPGTAYEKPNLSAVDGAEVTLVAVWEGVYHIDAPMRVTLGLTADYSLDEPALVVDEAEAPLRSTTGGAVCVTAVEDDGTFYDGVRAVFGESAESALLTLRAKPQGALGEGQAGTVPPTHSVAFGDTLANDAGLEGLVLEAWDGSSDAVRLDVIFGLDVAEVPLGDMVPWLNESIAHLSYTFAFVDELD